MAHFLVASVLACLAVRGQSITSFLVMGDWGGTEHSPYTTSSEVCTASGMNNVAQTIGAKFALALGDNMYHSGVGSIHDRRFNDTFENVFTGDALSGNSGFKFHLLAGNHDHFGNVSAQVAYSSVSPRWVFPSLYYSFTQKTEDNAIVQFVMIDTIVLAGIPSKISEQLTGNQLPGPSDQTAAEIELRWLEDTLRSSTADYLIVAGHYPIYSVCEHGPTEELQRVVRPLLEKYKVTAYLAGHDHCAEHIDVGDGVQYHGIGSAAYHDKNFAHLHTVSRDQLKYYDGDAGGGFASVFVSTSQMVITHHDDNGVKLYNNTILPRSRLSVVV